jgi:mono/diheme cytochrome c family protein
VGVAMAAAVGAGASVSSPGADQAQPDPAKVKAGMALYATLKCSTCHSIAGEGNKRYPLDGVGSKMSEADIRLWMTAPADMEAKLKEPPRLKMSTAMRSKKMTDADVDAVVAYMLSLK